ncbi:hydroxyacid dehydrogenase [Massilia terrae]|uniref:Hydroxyacid dehydrogenase n=1 Tax=Massilia terrae TaxID=1811224 RepID=A0ABT2D461_9BURK|nr:hydroxyacid dehydrogenase [Massilia terrae]MCS0660904.1 hydroxyacid dehydrogenase [Massilia terrae]
MKIVICEFMDEASVKDLQRRFDVVYDPQLVDKPQELMRELADAMALIVRNRTQVRGELLAAGPQLKVVGRLGVGLDNIDVAACEARGVAVIPATGANALAVAEYVISTAMVLLRGAYLSSGAVGAGKWPRALLSEGRESAGKTLGIVGFGGIGRLAAKLARSLGMRVIGYDPMLDADAPAWRESGATCCSLDGLLREADVVTLHVPLTDATHKLLDAARIGMMKPGAVLINTARGGIVDEAALAEALREGRLGGAALDVFEHEPLAAGSVLADVPNLILTPHIAGVTRESNERVSAMIAELVAGRLLGTTTTEHSCQHLALPT